MIWGSMSSSGVGCLQVISQTMTKEIYEEILENNLSKSAQKCRLGRRFIFQQDNDPKHTAKSIRNYFARKKIDVLPWPAQSPDLNPIEHLWEHLDRQVRKRVNEPRSTKDLAEILMEEWDQIPVEVTKNLVDSMPRRIEAVIRAKGGATKY